MSLLTPECVHGDHLWRGEGACVQCGERLRCICGQFVREDSIDAHLEHCPSIPPKPDGEED